MAWNEAVITTTGMDLLAKCLTEGNIVITRAVGGESCSAALSLLTLNSIKEPCHEMNLFRIENEGGKIVVNLRVQNKGLEEEYTLRQIGLFAKLEAEDSDVLFAVIQDSIGEVIPSESENPEFLVEFDFVIPVSNTENIDVAVTPNTFATADDILKQEKALEAHTSDKANPHAVTKAQVGLGNVPNVATNDQTPTYTEANTLTELSSGEKLSVAFGKLAKAVKTLISHIADNVKHITAAERTAWNGKAAGDHTHSAATQSAAGLMSAADKTKLDGIATGANKYTHPTSAGNKHIPSGGSSGQILRWSADGTAVWGNDNNTTYSNMKGASASVDGAAGLVPAPTKGNQTKYLRADGTWQLPPDTNTDTKVTQKSVSDNASYPLLLTPKAQTDDATATACFDGGVALNPYTNTITANIGGNSATSSKLKTARKINGTNFDGSADINTAKWGMERNVGITGDVLGTVGIDGSADKNIAVVRKGGAVGLNSGSDTALSKPWFKAASYNAPKDYAVNLTVLVSGLSTGNNLGKNAKENGILKIACYVKSDFTLSNISFEWLTASSLIDPANFVFAYKVTTGTSCALELWCKMSTANYRYSFDVLHESKYAVRGSYWTFYNAITEGSNAALPSGYTTVASTLATVKNNVFTATKATQDSTGQQINTTYIKGLSVNGKTITYTKGDGTTGTITTQDTNTTYSAATQSAAGLMSAADKTKLDGIATGANKYTHPTTAGNKHIPSGGSSGQILRWSADGTAVWGNDNRGCIVGYNSINPITYGTTWRKFADMLLPKSSATYTIIFHVSCMHGDLGAIECGILRARVGTDSNGTITSSELVWDTITSDLNPMNFVLTKTTSNGQNTVALHVGCTIVDSSYQFSVISEGEHYTHRRGAYWNLYNDVSSTLTSITVSNIVRQSTVAALKNVNVQDNLVEILTGYVVTSINATPTTLNYERSHILIKLRGRSPSNAVSYGIDECWIRNYRSISGSTTVTLYNGTTYETNITVTPNGAVNLESTKTLGTGYRIEYTLQYYR